jgi:hypothetical protein
MTQHFCCVLKIQFDESGNLPAGIHRFSWDEIIHQFGFNSYRLGLLKRLNSALLLLKNAGCKFVYLDGSFVTVKPYPNDYDCCWNTNGVDPNLLDKAFLHCTMLGRKLQRIKFKGEFFPSSMIEKDSGKPFLDFFQTDVESGERKGIVEIDLERIP